MMITVTDMQRAVLGLDDGRIMIGTGFGPSRIGFQVPFPFPRASVVIGDLNSQAVATAFGVVAHQGPMPVTQTDDLRARTGVGQGAVCDRTPGQAAIARITLEQPFGRGSVV